MPSEDEAADALFAAMIRLAPQCHAAELVALAEAFCRMTEDNAPEGESAKDAIHSTESATMLPFDPNSEWWEERARSGHPGFTPRNLPRAKRLTGPRPKVQR